MLFQFHFLSNYLWTHYIFLKSPTRGIDRSTILIYLYRWISHLHFLFLEEKKNNSFSPRFISIWLTSPYLRCWRKLKNKHLFTDILVVTKNWALCDNATGDVFLKFVSKPGCKILVLVFDGDACTRIGLGISGYVRY